MVRVHLRLRTAHIFCCCFFLYYCNQYGWLSFGHRFVYTRGLCDQFYRTSSTISDHLDNYAKCVRSCCNCSKIHRRSRVLHDHVSAVDLDPDSCELNGPTCCSCSSMDRLVTGCSRGQYARCLKTIQRDMVNSSVLGIECD